ncbi:MAG: hypothetical protein JSS49_03110 [Planctomycetes bacterium]|nr:hypothetical protein [Planctomycetota bacterium]
MSNFLIEELSHRVNRIRDDQARLNTSLEARIKELETENKEVRSRLMVLTRLLISRQIATAEEIATALAASLVPPTPVSDGHGVHPAVEPVATTDEATGDSAPSPAPE